MLLEISKGANFLRERKMDLSLDIRFIATIIKSIVPSCWAFLVAQMVKNLPAMQETRVQSLGQEDSLEEGMATYSNILAWEIHGQKSLEGYRP